MRRNHDAQVLGRTNFTWSENLRNVTLESTNPISETGSVFVEIIGFNGTDVPLFSVFRSIRSIPSEEILVRHNTSVSVTRDTANIYNRRDTLPTFGWNFLENGAIVVGNGTSYENNVDTSIGLFLNIDQIQLQPMRNGCTRSLEYISFSLTANIGIGNWLRISHCFETLKISKSQNYFTIFPDTIGILPANGL